jgi:hypothetical protein
MGRFGNVALTIAVVLGAVPAIGADVPMLSGKIAKFRDQTGTASDQALVKFIKEGAFATLPPSPMCPAVSTIRLRTDTQDVLATLDCSHWSSTGAGYVYHDVTAGRGGVQKVVLTSKPQGGKLLLKMRGSNYGANALTGPIAFLETQLTIQTAGYCGRFESPPGVFKANVSGKVIVSGPSTACIPATPTVTSTVSATPTVTSTATSTATGTITNTATMTATGTNTRTVTQTPTSTYTVPPGSTATDSPTPTATPTPGGVPDVFRIDSISLRDPHLFALVGTCMDATNPPGVLGLFSANGELVTLLNNDGNGDSFLDLNLLVLFRPLSQPPLAGSIFDIATGVCTPPVGGETCSPDANPAQSSSYANQNSGVCLAPIAGTTGPNNTGSYSPATSTPGAPCFNTMPVTISFPFGFFTVPLQDVRAGATYVGGPANQLADGLLTGFLSESDADSILLPGSIPILGNQPISSLLPGGSDNCAPDTAKDTGPLGQPGWYFYLNFTAHRVIWTGS